MCYRLRTLLIVLAIGPMALAFTPASEPVSDATKKAVKSLQGDWILVYWRFNGRDLDVAKELGVIGDQTILRFTDNRFVVQIGDKKHEEGTFDLDANASPPTFDSAIVKPGVEEGRKRPGIFLLKDDLFFACISYDYMRPLVFSAEAGSNRELVVYRRK